MTSSIMVFISPNPHRFAVSSPGVGARAASGEAAALFEENCALIENVLAGEKIVLTFPLKYYETVERAAGKEYCAQWNGNSVLALEPPGEKVPLYPTGESAKPQLDAKVGLCAPR